MTDFLVTNDGCRIAYDYVITVGKPTLVLSPSLGTAMALFDPQMGLAEHFSILRYDPRGHGASDVPEGGYSLDRLGNDVIELLDHLGIERAHFCGVSLGGMIGQWLGYRVPERMDRIILANTSAYMGPPSSWAERIAAVYQNGMAPMLDPVLERWFTAEFRNNESATADAVRTLLANTDPAGYAGCCAAIRDMDLRPTAVLIESSCLVVYGAHDPATPPEHAAQLIRLIADSTPLRLDTAHLSNIEQTDAFTNGVKEFLLTGDGR